MMFTRRPGTSRFSWCWRAETLISVVLLAAFGPYVAGGLRTEQIVVYGSAAVVIAFSLTRLPDRLTWPLVAVIAAWGLYVATDLVGLVRSPANSTPWNSGSLTAGLDNVLLPLAAMAVPWGLCSRGADPASLLRRLAIVLISLTSLNTVAAILQSRGADWSAWWSSSGVSNAVLAGTNGRFSGVINQPAEAGMMYGIALLCVVYLWPHRAWLLLALTFVTVIGGSMTVSKVFLFIAAPIVLWQVARMRSTRLLLAGVLGFGAYLGIQFWLLSSPLGAARLQAVLPNSDQSVLQGATAGRFGADSTLVPLIQEMLHTAPVIGLGPSGLAVSYDNGWIEALITAGLVGVLCYTAVIVIMMLAWKTMEPGSDRLMLGGLSVMALGASVGLPALTANRVSTVFWVTLTLLLLARRRTAGSQPEDVSEGASAA